MKSLAIFFNSPYLGGAERSMIAQSEQILEESVGIKLTFFVPCVEDVECREVEELLRSKFPRSQVLGFEYPRSLYETSRSGKNALINYLILFYGLTYLMLGLRSLGLGQYGGIWANGNKIAFPLFLFLKVFGFRGTFVWHFRDYPEDRGIFKLVWKALRQRTSFRKLLISNSYSVESSLKSLLGEGCGEYLTIYNPLGGLNKTSISSIETKISSQRGITIGLASMLAPWKGVHSIMVFEKLFRKELKALNIEEIAIYGGDIYSTLGEHRGYRNQLLAFREGESLINFKGKSSPQEIFSNIDILIHSSLRAEPFGRVIIEAFASRVPVISTCLGGSGELVIDGETGKRYLPYDYDGLMKSIRELIVDQQCQDLTKRAASKLEEVETQAAKAWKVILSDLI